MALKFLSLSRGLLSRLPTKAAANFSVRAGPEVPNTFRGLLRSGGIAGSRLAPGGALGLGRPMIPVAAVFGSFASASLSSLPSHLPLFSQMGLWGWLAIDVGINWLGWAVAATLKTEVFYDALGTVSFATLAIGSLFFGGPIGPLKILVTAMVAAWTTRLCILLVGRIHRAGSDSRFDVVKHQPGTFFIYWTMQAVWVFVSLLPVLVVNLSPTAVPIPRLAAIGAVVYAAGLLTETVADWQKSSFKANPANKGRFITEGLWAYSRHPNYFGEIVVWVGIFATCATSFTSPLQFLTVASPITVTCLLRFLSGVPILERQADQRWGTEVEYQQYKASTPVLVPLLGGLCKDTKTY